MTRFMVAEAGFVFKYFFFLHFLPGQSSCHDSLHSLCNNYCFQVMVRNSLSQSQKPHWFSAMRTCLLVNLNLKPERKKRASLKSSILLLLLCFWSLFFGFALQWVCPPQAPAAIAEHPDQMYRWSGLPLVLCAIMWCSSLADVGFCEV